MSDIYNFHKVFMFNTFEENQRNQQTGGVVVPEKWSFVSGRSSDGFWCKFWLDFGADFEAAFGAEICVISLFASI